MGETTGPLREYFRLLLAKRLVSLPTLALAALAAINAFRGSHDQLGLSAKWWLLLAGVGVMLGQFLVWRDHWTDEAAPKHAEQLHGLAVQTRSELEAGLLPTYKEVPLGVWALAHAFDAHFAHVVHDIGRFRAEHKNAEAERAALLAWVRETAAARFPYQEDERCPGWYVGDVRKHWEDQVPAILRSDPVGIGVEGETVIWGASPVFDARGCPEPSCRATEAEQKLRDWIREVAASDHARAYQTASEKKELYGVMAIAKLDPVIQHQAIAKAWRCEICFPRRKKMR